MRLFVVCASPPNISFSRPPARISTPQPPGPGLPLQAPSAYMSTPFSTPASVMPLAGRAIALRHRGQRAPAGALLAPGGRDQAHAVDALHRAHHVDPAHDRPPARARLVHEREARQPERVLEGRRIAAEAPAVELEAEQVQPILQPQQADEAFVPGRAGA